MLLAGTCPPFETQTLAPSINDRGHRVTATRTVGDLMSGAEETDGPGPPSEAGGCTKTLCKAPLPLKIRAAQGGPLGMGDSEGQDRASISHPELRSGGAVLPPPPPGLPLRFSFREVKQTGMCGAPLGAVTMEDPPADARPWSHRDVGQHAARLGPPRWESRGEGGGGSSGFVLDPGDFKEQV